MKHTSTPPHILVNFTHSQNPIHLKPRALYLNTLTISQFCEGGANYKKRQNYLLFK